MSTTMVPVPQVSLSQSHPGLTPAGRTPCPRSTHKHPQQAHRPQKGMPPLPSFTGLATHILPQDTTKFIRAPDVMPIYNSVVKQITRLNAIRDEQQQSHSALNPAPGSSTKPPPPPEANRVDQLLADVFGLLSLFFLTVGKSRETPAIYCQIASMRVSISVQPICLLVALLSNFCSKSYRTWMNQGRTLNSSSFLSENV